MVHYFDRSTDGSASEHVHSHEGRSTIFLSWVYKMPAIRSFGRLAVTHSAMVSWLPASKKSGAQQKSCWSRCTEARRASLRILPTPVVFYRRSQSAFSTATYPILSLDKDGNMENEYTKASRLIRELTMFLHREHDANLQDATEWQIHRFVEYLVDRPATYRDGRLGQRPIQRSLVSRIKGLARTLRSLDSPLRITSSTIEYAQQLQLPYLTEKRGAATATIAEIHQLVSALNSDAPRIMRLKAVTLLILHTFARPSEILNRIHPDDVNADQIDGIVLTVPTSKTNPGPKPERFEIVHHPEVLWCAVCALKQWIDWLGDGYAGRLFPMLRRSDDSVQTRPYSTQAYSDSLFRAFARAGVRRHLTAYSLRKARATHAAAVGIALPTIATSLRHAGLAQAFTYIDRDVLLHRMRNALE
jgi:integrase